MARLSVQFLDQSFHRVVFDAVPIPVFVVDNDVTVLEYNAAAAQFLGGQKHFLLRRRGGDVLHCVHSSDSAEGCGRGLACPDCIIRKSVRAAARGRRVTRRWAELDLVKGGRAKQVKVRLSCQPFKHEGHAYVLLMFEGLN
jgi:PAS domain-containing protein